MSFLIRSVSNGSKIYFMTRTQRIRKNILCREKLFTEWMEEKNKTERNGFSSFICDLDVKMTQKKYIFLSLLGQEILLQQLFINDIVIKYLVAYIILNFFCSKLLNFGKIQI
jgi:hypothetical protein